MGCFSEIGNIHVLQDGEPVHLTTRGSPIHISGTVQACLAKANRDCASEHANRFEESAHHKNLDQVLDQQRSTPTDAGHPETIHDQLAILREMVVQAFLLQVAMVA